MSNVSLTKRVAGKCLCLFGNHCNHKIEDEDAITKRLPAGLKLCGVYCCRCKRVEITEVIRGDKT